jgi:hypothetical protein
MQMLCRLNDDEGNTSYHHNRPIIAQELIRLHPLDETPHLPTSPNSPPKVMAGGAAIDCVLEMPGKERWAFAIKRSAASSIAKGFYIACEDVKPAKNSWSMPAKTASPWKGESR